MELLDDCRQRTWILVPTSSPSVTPADCHHQYRTVDVRDVTSMGTQEFMRFVKDHGFGDHVAFVEDSAVDYEVMLTITLDDMQRASTDKYVPGIPTDPERWKQFVAFGDRLRAEAAKHKRQNEWARRAGPLDPSVTELFGKKVTWNKSGTIRSNCAAVKAGLVDTHGKVL